MYENMLNFLFMNDINSDVGEFIYWSVGSQNLKYC